MSWHSRLVAEHSDLDVTQVPRRARLQEVLEGADGQERDREAHLGDQAQT